MADAWSPERLQSISSAEEIQELAVDIQSVKPKEATKAAEALKAHYEKLKEQGVLQSIAEKEIKTLSRVIGMKAVKSKKYTAFRIVLKNAHDLLEKNLPPARTIRSDVSDLVAGFSRAKGTGTVISPEETAFVPEMIKADNVLSIIFGNLVDEDKITQLSNEGYAIKSPTQLRKIVQDTVTEPPFSMSIKALIGRDALNIDKIAKIIKTTDDFDKFATVIKETLPKKPDETPVTPVDSGTISLREELEGEGGLDLGLEPEAETPPSIQERIEALQEKIDDHNLLRSIFLLASAKEKMDSIKSIKDVHGKQKFTVTGKMVSQTVKKALMKQFHTKAIPANFTNMNVILGWLIDQNATPEDLDVLANSIEQALLEKQGKPTEAAAKPKVEEAPAAPVEPQVEAGPPSEEAPEPTETPQAIELQPEIDLGLEEEPEEESRPELSTETGDLDIDTQFDDLLGVIWGDEKEEEKLEKLKKQGYKLGAVAQLEKIVEDTVYKIFKDIIIAPLQRNQILEIAKSTKDLKKIKAALIKALSEAEPEEAPKPEMETPAVASEKKSADKQLEELLAETEKPKPKELMEAIKANDAKQVETYLSKGVALDFFDEEDKTPLMRACAQGNFEIASDIYMKGGPKLVQQKNKSGQTAFTEAIAHHGKGKERFQIVSLLRENVFDIDNINSWVPVELAIENEHKKIHQYLIDTGARAKPKITEAEVPPAEPAVEPEVTGIEEAVAAPAEPKPKERPKTEDEIMEEKAKEVAPEEYQEWCNYFEILHFGRLPKDKEGRRKTIGKREDLLGTKSDKDYRFLVDELRKTNLRRFIDAKKPIIALREMSKRGEINVDNLKEKLNEKLTEVDEAIESMQLPMQVRRLEYEFQKAHEMAEKSADSMAEAEKQKHVGRMEQWAEQFRQKIKLVKPEPAKEAPAPAPAPAPAKPTKAPDIVGLTNMVKNNEALMSLIDELEEIRQFIERKEKFARFGITPEGFKSLEHFQNKLKKLEDNNDPLVRVKSRAQLIMEYLKIVKESDPSLFESWNPDESPKKLAEMLEKKWSKFLDILKK